MQRLPPQFWLRTLPIPELEGVKIDRHWAIIDSKYSIACALESAHDGSARDICKKTQAR
jgi:hypothetical protein